MKRTLTAFTLVAVAAIPGAQTFAATTQADLYTSYALAYAGDIALDSTINTAVELDTDAADMDMNTTVDVDAAVDATTTTDGDASVDSNGEATPEEGSNFVFARGDMTGESSVTSSSMVASRADLEAYASSQMMSDEHLEKAEFSNTSVSVWYKQPSKLFGFIPHDLTVHATANAAGEVQLEYPWYSFLASAGDKADMETAIQNQISTTLEANASGTDSSTFTSRMQAQILSDLRAGLSGE